MWRGSFSGDEISEAYKTTIRMYWESSKDELQLPPLGTEGLAVGKGRNRILEIIYKSNGLGMLRVVLSIVAVGIAGAAVAIGKDVLSTQMLAVVAFNLAIVSQFEAERAFFYSDTAVQACVHILLFTIPLRPRSKTDPKPTASKLAILVVSSAMWTAAVISLFVTFVTSDLLNVGNATTVQGYGNRTVSVHELTLRLRGHSIAAGCMAILAL
jgi:hypothetical protein